MSNTCIDTVPRIAKFYYTKAAVMDHMQRQNMVALSSTDTTSEYSLFTNVPIELLFQCGGIKIAGNLHLFYDLRKVDEKTTLSVVTYSLLTETGNAVWIFALDGMLFEKDKLYESFAIYKRGVFASSDFPRITARVLDDADETREYTIYF